MSFTRFLVATAIAGLATATAVAQGPGGLFRSADTNGDGMISHVEATAEANARFTAMDLNKDGFLTQDEMSGPGARMMARADSDSDGKVSRAEFLAQADQRFERIDTNKDGQISREELGAWMDRMRGPGGRDGHRGPGDQGPPPPPPSPNPGQ